MESIKEVKDIDLDKAEGRLLFGALVLLCKQGAQFSMPAQAIEACSEVAKNCIVGEDTITYSKDQQPRDSSIVYNIHQKELEEDITRAIRKYQDRIRRTVDFAFITRSLIRCFSCPPKFNLFIKLKPLI